MVPAQSDKKADKIAVYCIWETSQVVLVVKNLLDNAGDIRDMGLVSG